jgi:DNA-binding Xre family transcriptional regulator
MSGIQNNFRVLLAQKETRDSKTYSYDDIHEACGVLPNTLTTYTRGTVTRFDAKTLMALCDWLECKLSDLLVYPID